MALSLHLAGNTIGYTAERAQTEHDKNNLHVVGAVSVACASIQAQPQLTVHRRTSEQASGAAGRALPASLGGAPVAAASGGTNRAALGEGPVTRAVLKMGPCSCLEVAISNHPGLTAALKQCVKTSTLATCID